MPRRLTQLTRPGLRYQGSATTSGRPDKAPHEDGARSRGGAGPVAPCVLGGSGEQAAPARAQVVGMGAYRKATMPCWFASTVKLCDAFGATVPTCAVWVATTLPLWSRNSTLSATLFSALA